MHEAPTASNISIAATMNETYYGPHRTPLEPVPAQPDGALQVAQLVLEAMRSQLAGRELCDECVVALLGESGRRSAHGCNQDREYYE